MSKYEVRVTKDYLVFSAAHFITYGEGQCEALHGHNYRVSASLRGQLSEQGLVYDFVTLKGQLRSLVDMLDHRMLLPTENPGLVLGDEGQNVTVRFKEQFYSFPRREVALLPIPNTTAEMLARWLAEKLRDSLVREQATNVTAVGIEVEESFGQSATCWLMIDGS